MLIEYSEFDHVAWLPSRPRTPATSASCTKLAFHGNYSTRVVQGHLLKSRARENWVLYNRLTDETGTGTPWPTFPNGGVVVMAGNILDKGPKAQNNRVVAYGMRGSSTSGTPFTWSTTRCTTNSTGRRSSSA